MKSLRYLTAVCLAVAAVVAATTTVTYACRASFCTNQLGDGITYNCLLMAESTNYCYYECTPVASSGGVGTEGGAY